MPLYPQRRPVQRARRRDGAGMRFSTRRSARGRSVDQQVAQDGAAGHHGSHQREVFQPAFGARIPR